MAREPRLSNRHVVVIGASAGGVDALRQVVGSLPAGLPASVFVVLHVGEESHLPQVLDAAGPLRAHHAVNGEKVTPGRIYVAPPGYHLLLHDGHLLLRRGPRESLARPAIDPLFRSAACSFGASVIGVVLTGRLNDGTAGLHAIKCCGGVAVVQDPTDAVMPQMPRSALQHVEVDHCCPLSAIGPLLARLTKERAGATPAISRTIQLETAISAQEVEESEGSELLGTLSMFTCPECGGPLWQVADGGPIRYRCKIGHALTAETLSAAHAEEIDRTLSRLLRTYRQQADLTARSADSQASKGNGALALRLRQRSEDYQRDARIVGQLLHTGGTAHLQSAEPDAEERAPPTE